MCGVGQKWVDKRNITGTIIRHTLENLKDCSSGWELAVKKHRCSTIKEMEKTGKLNTVTHLLLLLLLRLKIIPLPLNFVPMTCMINGKKWWHEQWKECGWALSWQPASPAYEWAIFDTHPSGVSQASTTPLSPINHRNVSDGNKLWFKLLIWGCFMIKQQITRKKQMMKAWKINSGSGKCCEGEKRNEWVWDIAMHWLI